MPTEGGLEDGEGRKLLPKALRWPLLQHEDTGPSAAWSWRPLCRSRVGLRPKKLRYREGCHPPGLSTLHWVSLDPLSHVLLRELIRRPFGKPPASPGPRGPEAPQVPWAHRHGQRAPLSCISSPHCVVWQPPAPSWSSLITSATWSDSERDPGLAVTRATSDQ